MNKKLVDHYLHELKNGNSENAFHCLVEAGQDMVPYLVQAFSQESDPIVKAELVNTVWQCRLSSSIPFLAEALNDPNSCVWKSALDGLVALASAESIAILEETLKQESQHKEHPKVFYDWVKEALDQVLEAQSSE